MFWIAAGGMGGALAIVLVTLTRFPGAMEAVDESNEREPQAKPSGSLLKNPLVFFMLFNNALSTVGLYFLDNS